jgi:hypothetical protein
MPELRVLHLKDLGVELSPQRMVKPKISGNFYRASCIVFAELKQPSWASRAGIPSHCGATHSDELAVR